MIKKLFSYLKSSGIDVYLPAKKTGKCTSPYAVINQDKSEISRTGRGLYVYYSVSVIVPLTDYNALEELTAKVRNVLKNTSFKFYGSETKVAGKDYDGYKRTLTYRILKPLICKK